MWYHRYNFPQIVGPASLVHPLIVLHWLARVYFSFKNHINCLGFLSITIVLIYCLNPEIFLAHKNSRTTKKKRCDKFRCLHFSSSALYFLFNMWKEIASLAWIYASLKKNMCMIFFMFQHHILWNCFSLF